MKSFFYTTFLLCIFIVMSCSGTKSSGKNKDHVANIDLTHWKITIPTPKVDGKAMEVSSPEIFDSANNEILKEFMYNDSTDGSLVILPRPNSTTANTKYSRSELREQMVSGSNSTDWTFKEGGRMKVKMSVPQVSKDDNGTYHKIINCSNSWKTYQ